MKKIFISILLSLGVVGVFAQTTDATANTDVPLTKSGYKFLPEKGDYALGIDATPFLEYIGNSFNGKLGGNNAPTFDGVNSFGEITIYGKYFLKADRAIRAKLVINTGTDTYKQTVQDDYAASQPGYNGQTVVDVRKETGTDIGLIAGYEFRRGYRRLQGFYGGELGVGYFTGNTKVYEYANPITADNIAPSTSFGENTTDINNIMTRTLEINPRNQFEVMLGGFVGVEYFILPKLSIGGEFNLRFSAYTKGQTEITTEKWDPDLGRILETTTRQKNGTSSSLRLETIPQGNLFMMFYF